MAIAFRSAGTVGTSSTTTVTAGTPAGVLSTDVVIAVVEFDGATGVATTAPAGWTKILTVDNATGPVQTVWWALGSVASYLFTNTGNAGGVSASAVAACYSGVDNVSPINVGGPGQQNASSTTATAPTVTTTVANTQLVFCGSIGDGARGTAPTWTAVFGTVRASGGLRGAATTTGVAIADAAQAAAGATGAKTETLSVAAVNAGSLVALATARVAAADPGPPPRRGPMRHPGVPANALTHFLSPGAFPPTSTVQNLLQSLAGTLTSSGAIAKQANTSKAGTLTDSGALLKRPATSKAGTLTDSGALLKQPQKPLAGTLTSSATLAAIKIVLLALAGTLTSSGALLKQALKPLAGTLTSSGALLKQAIKAFAGSLASSGSVLKRVLKPIAGTLSSSATLTAIKIVLKSLAGALASSGALVKMTGKAIAGSLASSGAMSKLVPHLLVGTLSFLGALTGVPIIPLRPDGTDRFLAWLQLRAGFHRGRR